METPTSPTMRLSPPLQDHSMVPMAEIESPHENDVLSGRGVTTNRHPGNINFRQLVSLNKELYVTSTKRQKMSISKSIVEAVRSMDPPGRFLEKNAETGLWSDIGDKKAIEKTSQALRDGAASLRKQLSEDLGDPDFLSAVFDMDVSQKTGGGDASNKDNKEKETISPQEKVKDDKTAKVKPTVAKGHRRTKSNPTVGVTAKVKSMTALRKAKPSELPLSPRTRRAPSSLPTSPNTSQTLSPEREEEREPFQSPTSPRSQPCSPQSGWANRANWKRRNDQQQQRVPSETHEERIPDRYFSSSSYHRGEPGHRSMYDRSHSFEQPPYRSESSEHSRHHPHAPSRPYEYGAPSYPPGHYRPGPPPPPPMSQNPTSPLAPGSHHFSPHGYQSKPPLSPPSVPWSPRLYNGHSPHHPPGPPPHDYRRQGSPKYRFSPGGGYQVHTRPGPYPPSHHPASHHQSLHVPVLGGERGDIRRSMPSQNMPPGSSFVRPPPPPPPPYDHSPRAYQPASVPVEFTPPHSRGYDSHPEPEYSGSYDQSGHYRDHRDQDRHHPDRHYHQHHPEQDRHQTEQDRHHAEKDRRRPEQDHNHHPHRSDDTHSNDMDAQVYVEELIDSNTTLEIRENSIEATPSMIYDRDTSPSAVADVAPSEDVVVKKEDDFMAGLDACHVTKSGDDDVSVHSDLSRYQERDDEYKNPAYDDASISPLPFDYETLEVDDPESLMDIPENIMSLPIAQFEPLEPGAA